MEKILMVANWKMNPTTIEEAKLLFDVVEKGLKDVNKNVEVVICPPFVWLGSLAARPFDLAQGKIYSGEEKSKTSFGTQLSKTSFGVQLGAQDCFWEQNGAFTGEISPLMLKNLGCQYVIIGHSERRQYFNENNEIINKKIKAALKARLKPIFCLGEKEEEREQIKEILENQLKEGLKEISPGQITNLVIAYEPVWAISTENGKYCSTDDALSAYLMIKKFLTNHYSRSLAERVKILYGGSVDSSNAVSYIKEAKMDGLLVGGASLNASQFIKIVKLCQ